MKSLEREEIDGGIVWKGTAEQLVAAGVVSADSLRQWAEPVRRGRRRADIVLPSGRSGRLFLGRRIIKVWELYDQAERCLASERAKRTASLAARQKHWGTPAVARASAEQFLMRGVVELSRAFNATHEPSSSHRFDEDTRIAALRCMRELVGLFERGTITVHSAPRVSDPKFEAFIQALVKGAAP